MKENLEKVKLLARDLRNGKEFPRSPRETTRATCWPLARLTNAAPSSLAGRTNTTPIARSISGG